VSTPFENLSDEDKSARLLSYVQGRLTDSEQEAIDIAIADDLQWSEELAFYQGLSNAAEPAAVPAGQEFGWARLSKSIDQEVAKAAETSPAANDNTPFWRAAALALGFIALVQTGYLFVGTDTPNGEPNAETPIYVPVAQTAHLEARIIFVEDATSADISALLTQIDAEIVAGPSAIGLYDVRFKSEDSRDTGLEGLRDANTIVESATLK